MVALLNLLYIILLIILYRQSGLSSATLEIKYWPLLMPKIQDGQGINWVAGRSNEIIMPSLSFPTGLSSRPSMAIVCLSYNDYMSPYLPTTNNMINESPENAPKINKSSQVENTRNGQTLTCL